MRTLEHGVIPRYFATGAIPRCLNFGEKLSVKLATALRRLTTRRMRQVRPAFRRADNLRKGAAMSRDIVDALLYAALAIVHFVRAISGAE
jgi:hypothetical protein